VLWLRIYRISNEFYDYFSLKKSQSNKLKLKTTIGKLSSGKVNLSYGLSFTRQMPMRVSHRLCVMNLGGEIRKNYGIQLRFV
jgi:hypothetical protein